MAARAIFNWLVLLVLVLPCTAGLVLYGGVRFFYSAPFLIAVYSATVMFFFSRLWRAGRDEGPIRMPPGLLPLLAFAVYGVFLIGTTRIPYEALVESLKIASYVLCYWVVYQLAAVRGRWRICLAVPLVVGSLIMLYALIQHANESNIVLSQERPEGYGMRASGTLICPNHFAYVLQIFLIVGASLLPVRSAGWSLRLLAGYTVALCVPVLLLTQSRSGWIGAAVGLSTFALLTSFRAGRARFLFAAVAVPVAVAAVGVGLYFGSSMVQERVNQAIKGDMRPAIWMDTLDAIGERPWFGHGPASYRWIYVSYRNAYQDPEKLPHYAHNEILNTASDYGLVGIGLAGLVVVIVGLRFFGAFLREKNPNAAWISAGLLGCLAATATHAFFDFNLHIFAAVHLLLWVAAVTGGILSNTGSLRLRTLSGIPATVVCVAGIAVCVFLIQLTGRMLHAYLLTDEAKRLRVEELQYEEAEDVVERAVAAYPDFWRAHKEQGALLKTRAVWYYDREQRAGLARQSIVAYEECLARNPLDLDAKQELSRIYGDMLGDSERSIDLLDEIITFAPNHFYYHAELGLRLRRLGKDPEAFEVFRKARKLNPKNRMILLNLEKLREKLKIKPGAGRNYQALPVGGTKEF